MTNRLAVLQQLKASPTQIEEILAYNANVFNQPSDIALPLADEAFVEFWQQQLADTARSAFDILKGFLVQLNFPIEEGISETEHYQAVTRRGIHPQGSGLQLHAADQLDVWLHPTPAGHIPLIITRHRADFVALAQALSHRNEPVTVPDSKGAGVLTGYNNWGRVWDIRAEWEATNPNNNDALAWQLEFRKLIPHKERYQDRFILLSDGYYSAVQPDQLELTENEWREKSLIIRREHECTHYFTGRVFQSMRNNLVDELIADYGGIVAAEGRFRSTWFLTFMGLEDFPNYREGGRLQNYRGDPPLSDSAFEVIKSLLKLAAENLEQADQELSHEDPQEVYRVIMALTHFTLEELAAEDAPQHLIEQLNSARTQW